MLCTCCRLGLHGLNTAEWHKGNCRLEHCLGDHVEVGHLKCKHTPFAHQVQRYKAALASTPCLL